MRAALALLVFLVVACNSGGVSSRSSPAPSPVAINSGCASTPVLKGSIPAWLDEAGGHNNPTFLNYVLASPEIAAGFLFAYPLRAGEVTDPNNKILWVVGKPRNGSPLDITANPVDSVIPVVTMSFAPNASPGEIYPSIDNVPTPGCWHFELRWNGNVAGLDLQYV